MANPEHVEVVRKGKDAIDEWRRRNPGVQLDLARADLAGAELAGANIAGANIAGASLWVANLSGAILNGASLNLANLTLANLTSANLSEVNLTLATLNWAHLSGANFSQAWLGFTALSNLDLSPVIGLGTVNHRAPSSVGVDTLIASFRGAGNQLTPELRTFFQGAGVPVELLEALPKIIAEVKYYTSFISYGQPDIGFAQKLRGDLVARGVSCYLYEMDKTPGERVWHEIGMKRREAEKMVVLCSANALVRDGALREIEEQIDEDPDKMVPVSLDNLWTEPGFKVIRGSRDLKPFLLNRNYADFANLPYDQALEQLLKGLRRRPD
jgi:hypothetical protein